MGRGSGRCRRSRQPRLPGSRRSSRMAAPGATRCCSPRPIGRPLPGTGPGSTRSPNSPRRCSPRANAGSRALVQGEAFLKAVETGWPSGASAAVPQAGTKGRSRLPVAVGLSAAAGAARRSSATLAAYLTGFAANLVSAAIRLAPIGQSDGLRVLAAPGAVLIGETARRAAAIATRRPRHLRAALRHRIDAPRNPDDEAVPLMIEIQARTPARRRRRPGRLRQDGAGRRALQAPARALRHRRHHQRHLHQGGRRVPDPVRRAGARAHHGRGDRRLPAHRDPRGRLGQSRRRRRHEPALSRPRHHPDRIGRRQSRRLLLARARRPDDLRHRRLGGRQDPAQGRTGHDALGPSRDQQDRPRALRRRRASR